MPKTIFVVDDSDTNLSMAENALEAEYRVMTLPSAAKMFALLAKVTPDLLLLDIEMPEMSGFEALQILKSHNQYADIPVIILTGVTDASTEARGFELGAVDFIIKPFSVPVLLNRIKTHLNIDRMIRERTARLKRLQSGIVHVFADIIENRDRETGGHIERTAVYIKSLIVAMMAQGVYAEEMRGWDLDLVASSARLHDVGKIAISDFILNKPGPLTLEEFETMKTHAAEGKRIIEQIVSHTGEVDFLQNAKLFAGYHHEYWDGTGYPHGLKGAEIPLQGRIMAVVDVYDALVSERPYKKAFTGREAVGIIMADAGKRFDPNIARVFSEVQARIDG
ncbi:MAG: response regulator [Deltaproteobacteria bacterium]|jgi:putative two-component system response regulator|nr:response regulator [Deltaproteobacteria bacterium]